LSLLQLYLWYTSASHASQCTAQYYPSLVNQFSTGRHSLGFILSISNIRQQLKPVRGISHQTDFLLEDISARNIAIKRTIYCPRLEYFLSKVPNILCFLKIVHIFQTYSVLRRFRFNKYVILFVIMFESHYVQHLNVLKGTSV
jgi:hypothetical protein